MLWIESTRSSASNDEVLERHAATIQRNLHRFRPIAEFRNVNHDDAARDEDELLGLLEGDGVLIHSRRLAAIPEMGRDHAETQVTNPTLVYTSPLEKKKCITYHHPNYPEE